MTQISHHWEDFAPGWHYESPPRTLTSGDITSFAREYDPQTYHTDEEAAKASPFGGLIASGWQTCSVAMRLMCDGYLLRTSCIGSPGLDELRWLRPVHPGDVLRVRMEVLEARPMASKPQVGLVRSRWEVRNQHETPVLTMEGWGMFGRRPAA